MNHQLLAIAEAYEELVELYDADCPLDAALDKLGDLIR